RTAEVKSAVYNKPISLTKSILLTEYLIDCSCRQPHFFKVSDQGFVLLYFSVVLLLGDGSETKRGHIIQVRKGTLTNDPRPLLTGLDIEIAGEGEGRVR